MTSRRMRPEIVEFRYTSTEVLEITVKMFLNSDLLAIILFFTISILIVPEV